MDGHKQKNLVYSEHINCVNLLIFAWQELHNGRVFTVPKLAVYFVEVLDFNLFL